MKNIDYSIVIRTMGKAEKKYRKLLDSIDKLELKPKEVIVVLPEGFNLPKEKLGYEKFVFSKKGMISQRMYGLYETKCDYILFCDDDISFDSKYISKLYEPIKQGIADATIGPLLEFFPKKGVNTLIAGLLAGATPTIFNKSNYTTILRSSGWSYNRLNLEKCEKYYNAQSAAWTNFFIKREVMLDLKFEDEMWLEKPGYAFLDDQTMFYKLYKMGYRTILVADAIYTHEDAKTSTKELKLEPVYASGFNRYVFWHRFIYSTRKDMLNKLLDTICFNYWYVMNSIYNKIRKNNDVYETFVNGVKDGKQYVKSKEYKSLSLIKNNRTNGEY